MAEKRYYWLKLKEDYFNSPKIKKLRKIAGGDTYTIIYLKMQLLSIRNQGIIEFEGIEPTLEEELALKLDEDVDNVKITLAYLNSQALYDINDDNQMFLPEASSNIGSEGQSAERKREFDKRKKENLIPKEPKSNALRQRQFRAKEVCKQIQHIPLTDDYTNNKRYNGNYYVVFKRDKMKCVICGDINCLCVHHIDGYDENKPENSNENKMITLCRTCHSRVHAGLNIPENILQSIDYYEFCNESNEIGNASVTQEKRNSISISSSISNIYYYWNEKDIIKHKELTEDRVKSIQNALKKYSEEEIKTYIDRYAMVLKDENYFFNYRWKLVDFLNRKEGIAEFTDEGSKWLNYKSFMENKPINTNPKKPISRKYDPKEIEEGYDNIFEVEV